MPKRALTVVTHAAALVAAGCHGLPWPSAPLYPPPAIDPGWTPPATKAEAMDAVAGHYAHFDIVAYETVGEHPMRTFIVSYGFTDFVREGEQLVQYDRFCHAEQKINQRNVESVFSDAATQAISPRSTPVSVFRDGDAWRVWRPATPTLVGIAGDPNRPLSADRNDSDLDIKDDDGDGKPGVTVELTVGWIFHAELYLARREVFQSCVTLYPDGRLVGWVIDDSEQLVIGATYDFLNRPNNPKQYRDPGLNPVILVPIPGSLDTCDELMSQRSRLFPDEPEFGQ